MILVTLKSWNLQLTTSAVAVLLTQTETDIFVKAGSAQVVEWNLAHAGKDEPS